MGSLVRRKSAHQADVKGKGILYDDDDAPIKLVDRDDSYVIKDSTMSLIGKILNPKKQTVEKLLHTMPAQWGLADRITASDLGNGKFLLTFKSEEDINSVLRQGPFHYNFCMFVLVRWEPIVHDDYPWIIPFWVQLIGFPLHLWTDANLRNIGSRIGHVDTVELTEGRMLIEVDSRRPLKFSRKAEYGGDEITIEIRYDKLFKHCTICGLLSHEKVYCPTEMQPRLQQSFDQSGQIERPGVFERVQLPHAHSARQSFTRQPHSDGGLSRQSSLSSRNRSSYNSNARESGYNERYVPKESNHEIRGFQAPYWKDKSRRGNHSDRIIRRKDDYSRVDRNGGSRFAKGPYDRIKTQTWRAKQNEADRIGCVERVGSDASRGNREDVSQGSCGSRENVSYEHFSGQRSTSLQIQENVTSVERPSSRKLASTIVTPSRLDYPMAENVTVRNIGEGRYLTFSPLNGKESFQADDQIIEALHDMELVGQQDGEMMDVEVNEDDLLAIDLMELEDRRHQNSSSVGHGVKDSMSLKKRNKSGGKRGAPLGIPCKKFEIIRRGSPSAKSAPSGSHGLEEGSKQQRYGSKKSKTSSSRYGGLMSSKNSSRNHP
ncbi:hypothetical protein Bca52824_022923 [Brassica carinata]|uniref:DUF4283 domain-containing protein n=1 Tax=Brassica carinata TaxID=52824 RepID=A0A8X7VHH0_BRACI|nr:hypothetical protein Bca52824_022923 [Brassica carinata]